MAVHLGFKICLFSVFCYVKKIEKNSLSTTVLWRDIFQVQFTNISIRDSGLEINGVLINFFSVFGILMSLLYYGKKYL